MWVMRNSPAIPKLGNMPKQVYSSGETSWVASAESTVGEDGGISASSASGFDVWSSSDASSQIDAHSESESSKQSVQVGVVPQSMVAFTGVSSRAAGVDGPAGAGLVGQMLSCDSELALESSAVTSQGVFTEKATVGDKGGVPSSSTRVSGVEGPELADWYDNSTDESPDVSCSVHSYGAAKASGITMLTGRAAVESRLMIADSRADDDNSDATVEDESELKKRPKESDTAVRPTSAVATSSLTSTAPTT
jgi:hypothetical protein